MFNEVEDIAEHMIEQKKGGGKSRKDKYVIVKDLMKHKMNDPEKYLKQVTEDLKKSKVNLSMVIRENTIVRREFMDLVDMEIDDVWKDGKTKNDKKAIHLVKKYIKKEPIPDMHLGVCISDDKLDEVEIELNKKRNDKPANYAEIEKDDDKPATYAGSDDIENKSDKPAMYAGIEGITNDKKGDINDAPKP